MKTFIWLVFVAFGFFCWTCCVASGWLNLNLTHRWRHNDLPAFTALITSWPFWLLLVPLPWNGWVFVLTRRKEVSAASALRFAGSICLAVAIFFFLVLVGSLLPFTLMETQIR